MTFVVTIILCVILIIFVVTVHNGGDCVQLNSLLEERLRRPRRINPFIEGPAPPEDISCTRRNGCLDRTHLKHRLDTNPIALQIGKGNMLGVTYESGYPPELQAPVSRWLTEIPPPPNYAKFTGPRYELDGNPDFANQQATPKQQEF